jgi:hypothetical protein
LIVKKYCAAIFVLAAVAMPVAGFGWDTTGRWEAQTMGAQIRADITQQGDKISGVARVHNPGGKKNTYHFFGAIHGNHISAAHGSGHNFTGSVTSVGRIDGVLRTKSGHSVAITAFRR